MNGLKLESLDGGIYFPLHFEPPKTMIGRYRRPIYIIWDVCCGLAGIIFSLGIVYLCYTLIL